MYAHCVITSYELVRYMCVRYMHFIHLIKELEFYFGPKKAIQSFSHMAEAQRCPATLFQIIVQWLH